MKTDLHIRKNHGTRHNVKARKDYKKKSRDNMSTQKKAWVKKKGQRNKSCQAIGNEGSAKW